MVLRADWQLAISTLEGVDFTVKAIQCKGLNFEYGRAFYALKTWCDTWLVSETWLSQYVFDGFTLGNSQTLAVLRRTFPHVEFTALKDAKTTVGYDGEYVFVPADHMAGMHEWNHNIIPHLPNTYILMREKEPVICGPTAYIKQREA